MSSKELPLKPQTPTPGLLLSPLSTPISLQFIDLSYRVKLTGKNTCGGLARGTPQMPEERTILDGITGQVASGQLLAVLGPSGSGKSTLLTILAGRLPGRHGGSVLANGRPASRSIFRRIGFVPQDDVLYPHLTVRETLTYCAMLRLPRSGETERRDRVRASVEAVIGELGLTDCTETAIGGAFVRGVSGGERKRVSIGHEMLLNPSVVVVDEPTSGLDATAAGRMVELLVGMARKGRAVVASVHQPSSRAYQMFDALLLLAEGRCLYFGRARDAVEYFGSIGFAPAMHVNPADFMLDLANGVAKMDCHGDVEEKISVKQSLISSYDRMLAPRVKASINASITASIAYAKATTIGSERSINQKEAKDFTRISWFSQFSILLCRSLKERRHETFNSLRILQVIAAAFLAGSMWWHSSIKNVRDRLGLLFFISIFWGVFASFNAVFTFPQEQAIFIKERASGMYSLSSYFVARMVGDLPMELILPAIFSIIIYWMARLRPELDAFLLTLLVLLFYVLVAQGLGLAMGAAIMDGKQASTLVTITMLSFLLTGGFYVQDVPNCMAWLKYTSFTFYCFRLLIGVQYRDEMSSYLGTSGVREIEIEGQVSIAVSIVALGAMFVAYRLLAYAALRRIIV
ncbi:ABC transporter G family member 25 isoform X2 [Dendrobium catenatum]|uniref:ABC transporter G family member 25 n=1 Tax=Dendrobium catenatum TaxID=906689 RepID=A0A2I0W6P3_9ASPA|nr:ABC transporter G family member 25 isoform X2 [Dendrobium catenatum]PKU71334.1 ABC transporter G family member 25 [Dendrobium catenatum]